MIPVLINLGNRIRELRQKKGLKQSDLASALQVSVQAVSKWERHTNAPDLSLFLKLAKLLDVTSDYLLGITEETPGLFEATVFCSGLRQFAKKSAAVNSREVADMTNVLFHHLTNAVLKYDGVPVKYVGDGFLCFFSGAAHADRALHSALHAQKILQDRNLVITLNSGEIYLGTIGHPDYASRDICGDTVNLAFLISGWVAANCPSGIGLTAKAREKLHKPFSLKKARLARVPELRARVPVFEPHTTSKSRSKNA